MDPTVATTSTASAAPVASLNIEYFFLQIYNLFYGTHVVTANGGFNLSGLIVFLSSLWLLVTVLSYIVSLGFLALLVYSTIRMYQIQDEDALRYATITDVAHAEEAVEHHRWAHVRELIESSSESDWRQAILEADIILDDMLTRLGYQGSTIGDKLKQADPNHFHTIRDAWEAHIVRNDIAHRGSAFELTDHIAYRTILQYENVFKEHGEI